MSRPISAISRASPGGTVSNFVGPGATTPGFAASSAFAAATRLSWRCSAAPRIESDKSRASVGANFMLLLQHFVSAPAESGARRIEASKRLQILQQRLLLLRSKLRPELVSATAVAGISRGAVGRLVSEVELRLIDRESHGVDVIARPDLELFHALCGRLEELGKRRHGGVVQIGGRRPNALQHARLIFEFG